MWRCPASDCLARRGDAFSLMASDREKLMTKAVGHGTFPRWSAIGFDRIALHSHCFACAPVWNGSGDRAPEATEFCGMRRAHWLGVLGAAGTAFAAYAAELPDGANRALVATQCTACHDLQPLFDAAGISRDDWNGALDEMTSYGLKVTPEERGLILEYLATYLGPSAKK
jgi:hypothetical protein